MNTSSDLLSTFVILFSVIDPIGTLSVFLSVTSECTDEEKRRIAKKATVAAGGMLLFFIVVGEVMLELMEVSILSFQIAGGVVLFLFALTMIFGESKPEQESHLPRSVEDIAIFPLATPSLASPGAMMAVVLLTKNATHTIVDQVMTTLLMLLVLAISYVLMRAASRIGKIIGTGGAGIISRVMGLVLASIAASNILDGIKSFFA